MSSSSTAPFSRRLWAKRGRGDYKYSTDVTGQVVKSRRLQAALQETQAVAKLAIKGNLGARVPMQGKTGEIEALCHGINSLLDATMTLIISVKNTAQEVQSGAEEISRGNTGRSQCTEEQSSSLAESSCGRRA